MGRACVASRPQSGSAGQLISVGDRWVRNRTVLVRRVTVEDMTDDAVAVMDELGWESAHLFGVSLSGTVAQRVAVRHPDRVRSLTSASAGPETRGPGRPALRQHPLRGEAQPNALPRHEGGRGPGGAGRGPLLRGARPALRRGEALTRAEALADAGARDTGAQSRQIGAQWSGPPISSVTAPTLVPHGEDDPLIRPRAATVIASRIPGARLVTLPGVVTRFPPRPGGPLSARSARSRTRPRRGETWRLVNGCAGRRRLPQPGTRHRIAPRGITNTPSG